jgi:hypothetical protein
MNVLVKTVVGLLVLSSSFMFSLGNFAHATSLLAEISIEKFNEESSQKEVGISSVKFIPKMDRSVKGLVHECVEAALTDLESSMTSKDGVKDVWSALVSDYYKAGGNLYVSVSYSGVFYMKNGSSGYLPLLYDQASEDPEVVKCSQDGTWAWQQ